MSPGALSVGTAVTCTSRDREDVSPATVTGVRETGHVDVIYEDDEREEDGR